MDVRMDIIDLVVAIEAEMKDTCSYTGRDALHHDVRAAIAEVPRHKFVPADQQGSAYENNPLPIGHGQTISQPYIVALMTDLLDTKPTDRVLEVGTGSGYQAAVLSRLVSQVYTIEIIDILAKESARRLTKLGYGNVLVAHRDGSDGWPEHAPYDGIIATAAAEKVPQSLVEQLKEGGKLIIPIGTYEQWIVSVTKLRGGDVDVQKILPVRFVPFV